MKEAIHAGCGGDIIRNSAGNMECQKCGKVAHTINYTETGEMNLFTKEESDKDYDDYQKKLISLGYPEKAVKGHHKIVHNKCPAQDRMWIIQSKEKENKFMCLACNKTGILKPVKNSNGGYLTTNQRLKADLV